MNDLILLVSIFVGTYACSVGFAIILMKLFFPLKTKEEMKGIITAQAASARQARPSRVRVSQPSLKVTRQMA